MKLPSQTDPSGPNGAQQKSGNSVPGPLGLNLRNSHEFRMSFVRILYEFVGNSHEICANLADSYVIRAKVARAFCEFHQNLQIRTKFVRNSHEIRTKFARNSYEIRTNFVRISEISKSQQKINQIHVKFTQIHACVNLVNSRCVHGD